MGITKSDIFTKKQNEWASIAKAFAHPARIAILEHLIEEDKCICGDLVNEIGLAQSTISQHLKELKNAKLIQGNIEGTTMCYCLNKASLRKIKSKLDFIFNKLNLSNKCC